MNSNPYKKRDHGGGIDAAVVRYGGHKSQWVDLSTGINPIPYPVKDFPQSCWASLPDQMAQDKLETTARDFWNVPIGAALLAAPGASALIARIPTLIPPETIQIKGPTYNEHAAAFKAHGWQVSQAPQNSIVAVHPNNPDGRLFDKNLNGNRLTIIDESFCDTLPAETHIKLSTRSGTLILKSFGKFWGLAGLRLGFAIGDPELISQLRESLGPWPVSGPALAIGTAALNDTDWAIETRARLIVDAKKLDQIMTQNGATPVGGTTLFRLYDVDDATVWQDRLARAHIWTRIFPYSDRWLRLGLPAPHQWQQLKDAL